MGSTGQDGVNCGLRHPELGGQLPLCQVPIMGDVEEGEHLKGSDIIPAPFVRQHERESAGTQTTIHLLRGIGERRTTAF